MVHAPLCWLGCSHGHEAFSRASLSAATSSVSKRETSVFFWEGFWIRDSGSRIGLGIRSCKDVRLLKYTLKKKESFKVHLKTIVEHLTNSMQVKKITER